MEASQLTLSGQSVEEEEFVDARLNMLCNVLFCPVIADDWTDGTPLRTEALVERLGRVHDARTADDLDEVLSLTDADVLQILMNGSHHAPPDSTAYEAMKYYFKRVKGEEAYSSIFDDEPVRMDEVEFFKHSILPGLETKYAKARKTSMKEVL